MPSASSRASSSASRIVADVLARWPEGVDVIRASALDRHDFSTRRAVVIVADAPIPYDALAARYPAEALERARASEAEGAIELPPQGVLEDLATVAAVARIAERLRAPDGCPWDREQTHASLRALLLEEAYEALDAIERDDPQAMREELGDLLFHIAIHAQLASEEGRFDLGAIARTIAEKLVRRHPHVFAGASIAGGDLLLQWERIKRTEKPEDTSMLAGLPRALPALYAAQRMQDRAARVGLVPERVDLPLDVDESEQLGELLFELVALARERGWDAEEALRAANRRFTERLRAIEARGRPLEDYAPDELRALWEEAR